MSGLRRPAGPASGSRRGPRRRRGQNLVEFSVLAVIVFGFVMTLVVAAVYLLQAWSLSNVARDAGEELSTTGFLDVDELTARAAGYYVSLDADEGDSITVQVRGGSETTPQCSGERLSDGVCTYEAFTDAYDPDLCTYEEGCAGFGATNISVNYGDYLRIVVSRSGSHATWMLGWFGLDSISSAWSGIAQRNTVTTRYSTAADTGSLTITVVDSNLDPIPGATVAISPTTVPRTETTSESGIADFGDLAPGSYTVTAYQEAEDGTLLYQPQSVVRVVRTGYQTSYDLVLINAAWLDLYLTQSGSGANRADNGDFEDALSSAWSGGSAGYASYAGEIDGSVETSASGPYGGGLTGRFTTTLGSTGGGIWSTLTNSGAVTAGHRYRAVLWLKAPLGTGLLASLGDFDGTDHVSQSPVTASGTWQQVTLDWTASANTDTGRVGLRDARDCAASATFGCPVITVLLDEVIVYDTTLAVSPTGLSVSLLGGTASPQIQGSQGLYRFATTGGSGPFTLAVTLNDVACDLDPDPEIAANTARTSTRVVTIDCTGP